MKKRIFAIMLALVLVAQLCPVPLARAEGETCTHHTQHTDACGYKDAVAEVPCGHVHTPACYTCTHACSESCEFDEETGICTTHVCAEECLNCPHVEHVDCGYIAGQEARPCGFDYANCAECAAEAAAQLCAHGNSKDTCEACAAEAKAAQLSEVQALIDALPEAVTADTRAEVESQLTAIDGAMTAYGFGDAEKAALDFTKHTAALTAIAELDGQPDVNVPDDLDDGEDDPAPTSNVAKVGDVVYGSLAEAFTAAQSGDTVTLLASTEELITLGNKNINNLTITAAEGVTVKGIFIDTKQVATGLQIDGLTLKNIHFVENGLYFNCESGNGTPWATVKNLTMDGCSFSGVKSNTETGNSNRLFDVGASSTGSNQFWNIVIKNCTVNEATQGIRLGSLYGTNEISNNKIFDACHNAINLGSVHGGTVTVSGNTISNGTDRAFRVTTISEGATVAFNNNIITSTGDNGSNYKVNTNNGAVTFSGNTVDGEAWMEEKVASVGDQKYADLTSAVNAAASNNEPLELPQATTETATVTEAVAAVAKSSNVELTIPVTVEGTTATVKLNNDAVKNANEKISGGATVTLTIEENTANEAPGEKEFDITLQVGNDVISQLGGTATVTMPAVDAKTVKVYCVGNNGREYLEGTFPVENGNVTFPTTHFSTWGTEAVADEVVSNEPVCATVTVNGVAADNNPMTLSAAIQLAQDSAAGSTVVVTLTESVELPDWQAVNFSKSLTFTLDGNGHTISNLGQPLFLKVNTPGKEIFTIQNLTISNPSIDTTSLGTSGEASAGALICWHEGHDSGDTLNIKNVTVSGGSITSGQYSGGLFGYTSAAIDDGQGGVASVHIENCTVSGVTITGGSSIGGLAGHIQSSDCTISGSKVAGNTLKITANRADKIGVTVGTSNCATYIDVTETAPSTVYVNGAVDNDQHVIGRVLATVVISGGKYYTDPTQSDLQGTGASFTHDGQVRQGTDGMYSIMLVRIGDEATGSYYPSLADAITAATDGATITLLGDISRGNAVTIDKNLTIDMASKEYTAYADPGGTGITVSDGKQLTLKGGTLELGPNVAYALALNGGTMILDGCTIDGNVNVLVSGNSTLNLGGNTVNNVDVAAGASLSLFGTGTVTTLNTATGFGSVTKETGVTVTNTPNGYGWTDNKLAPISYAITYMDGTDVITGLTPATYTIAEAVTLPTPTKAGYQFDGWYGNADLSGSAVTEIAQGQMGEKTFYAAWTLKTYTITYMDGTTAIDGLSPATFTILDGATLPTTYVKTGYTFGGWYDTPDFSHTQVTMIAPGAAMNITVYAKLTPNQYTITFDTAGGNTIAPITQAYGSTVTAPAAPTKTGYTFKGWDKAIPTTMPAENVTVTATWEANQYTLTFDTDGGTEMAPAQVTFGTSVAAPTTNPTKTGYTFDKWVNGNGDPAGFPFDMPAGDVTLTATWTAHTYTVKFHPGTNGSGTMADQAFTYGVAQALTENAFTNTDQHFAGWATTEGGAVVYADGASVSGLTAEDNAVVDLYAVWTAKLVREPDLKVQVYGLNNSAHTYKLDAIYTVKYFRNGVEVKNPTDAGIYDVDISAPATDEYAAFHTVLDNGLIIAPVIVEGMNQSVVRGNAATFKSNANYSDFIRVELDGYTLDEKYYNSTSGSIRVTLHADFVKTLAYGTHTLSIVSDLDGTVHKATTNFTVYQLASGGSSSGSSDTVYDSDSPKTGDITNTGIYLALALVGLAGVLTTLLTKKLTRKRK